MFRRGQPFVKIRRSHFAENVFVNKMGHVRDDHTRNVPVHTIDVLKGRVLIPDVSRY